MSSHIEWLRNNQSATPTGPIGKLRTGTAAPPFIEGSMFRKAESLGNDADPEWTMFDAKMSVFRSNRGPPPAPLCHVRGCQFVAAYAAWYNTTGIALTKAWEAKHPKPAAKPAQQKPAAPVAPAPKKEGPSRVVLEVSESSGW